MKQQLYSLLTIYVILFITSCQKDEVRPYEGRDSLSIYVDRYEADSTSFNFAFGEASSLRDTVFVKTRIQGRISQMDRVIQLKATEGTDAVEGIDYILPEAILKAGETSMLYPIVIIRTDALKTKMKSLNVAVKENDFFDLPAMGQEQATLSHSLLVYQIKFNDFFSEPFYWSTISSQVGVFSVAKLVFMMQVYNRKDFIRTTNGGTLTQGEFLNLRNRLKAALIAYEQINGKPLIDEITQLPVTFD